MIGDITSWMGVVFLNLPGFWFGDGAHHPTVRLQFKYPDIYNFSNFSLW